MSLLQVEGLSVRYGVIEAVREVSLTVDEGEIVALLGANGAGKTSTLSAIVGLVPAAGGDITFGGKQITGWPTERIVRGGMTMTPEGRRVFAALTVDENLVLGSAVPSAATRAQARCPADSSNSWRSPARSCRGRGCCCSTSRRLASRRKSSTASST